jgi:hypothetical protein
MDENDMSVLDSIKNSTQRRRRPVFDGRSPDAIAEEQASQALLRADKELPNNPAQMNPEQMRLYMELLMMKNRGSNMPAEGAKAPPLQQHLDSGPAQGFGPTRRLPEDELWSREREDYV